MERKGFQMVAKVVTQRQSSCSGGVSSTAFCVAVQLTFKR